MTTEQKVPPLAVPQLTSRELEWLSGINEDSKAATAVRGSWTWIRYYGVQELEALRKSRDHLYAELDNLKAAIEHTESAVLDDVRERMQRLRTGYY